VLTVQPSESIPGHRAEGKALGSCTPGAVAAHAGLAAVAVCAVALIWE